MAAQDIFARNGRSRTLIVFVHGMNRGPNDFALLMQEARDWLPDADVLAPRLPLGSFSTTRAADIASDLAARIAARVAEGEYEDVVLVGHSIGALMIRAAWMLANGARDDGTVDLSQRANWTSRVSRIVLLAALGRGWRQTVALSPGMRLLYWATSVYEHFLILPRLLPLEHRRGAPFLTTVRLQSLALDEAAKASRLKLPPVVQVLGTIDDLVAPSDNVDLITGAAFQYVEAEETGHSNVVTPDTPVRRSVLHFALTGRDLDPASRGFVIRDAEDVADRFSDAAEDFDDAAVVRRRKPGAGKSIDTAVMIVHGIRDYGYWTKRLAGVIKDRAREMNRQCRTVTSSYGFFPMGPFVSPAGRRQRVEWFLDQYVQARSRYPNADISFVGHSNGTYLLAGALKACPAVRFDRVVFAGSVVRTNYEWDDILDRGQVKHVLNYVATRDWVVAGFPKFLGRLRIFDLGAAGTDGFRESRVKDVEFVKGAHDAAIVQSNWNTIAGFVLSGSDPVSGAPPGLIQARSARSFLAAMSVLAVPGLIALALMVGLAAYVALMRVDAETLHILASLAVAGFAIKAFLTRF